MRAANFRRSFCSFAFVLSLAIGGFASAADPDEEGELTLNSEFMLMKSFGDDIHVFTIKLENDTNDSSINNTTNTGVSLDSDSDFGWRGDLQWKEGAWGVGISGFHFDDEGDDTVLVDENAASDEVSIKAPFAGTTCNDNGDDDDDDFCYATASTELETWMIDLYGIRELVATPDVGVDLQFGLRIADIDWEVEGVSSLVRRNGSLFEINQDDGDPDYSNFQSTSGSDDPLVGPFLSLLSTGRFGRFRVEGQITQSVVFGDYELDNIHRQLDNSVNPQPLDSPTFGDLGIRTLDEDVVIPITDIRIKLGYDILDNLTLGFGAYSTTWFNVPSPPNSTANDFETAKNIESDDEVITFLGASFSLAYRFVGGGLFPNF